MRRHTLKVRLAAVAFAGFALSGCAAAEKEAAAVQQAGDTWLLVEKGERVVEEEEKSQSPCRRKWRNSNFPNSRSM